MSESVKTVVVEMKRQVSTLSCDRCGFTIGPSGEDIDNATHLGYPVVNFPFEKVATGWLILSRFVRDGTCDDMVVHICATCAPDALKALRGR